MVKEWIHTLNGVVIEEPIGFDNMKTTIKREDYHGMSVEVSVSELEFYGNALPIIDEAYEKDLDTVVEYKVMHGEDDVYKGVLDLTTYNEHVGEYRTVSCKVGEIGVKTTFNNRSDVEVDLNTHVTMDDKPLSHVAAWKNLTIPNKTIRYKNVMDQPETILYDKNLADEELALPDDSKKFYLSIPLSNKRLDEFGSFGSMLYIAGMKNEDIVLDGFVEPMFDKGEGFAGKYGEGSTYTLDVDVTVRMKFNGNIVTPRTDTPYFQVSLGIRRPNLANGSLVNTSPIYISNDGGDYNAPAGSYDTVSTYDCHDELTYHIKGKIEGCDEERLYLGIYMFNNNDGWNDPTSFTIEIQEGSYVRMVLDSEVNTRVSADMMMVHEALNTITEVISENELSVRSSLYNRYDSIVNAFNGFGDGSLKAITNGYKIRGLYSDAEKQRNMPLSFKDMIQALDAIDCIGWGFSNEDGELCLRVEKWDWFYQDHHLLEITNPSEVSRRIDNELILTELKIGYKKYMTSEDISSIDSVHGERVFTSSTKALTNSENKLCDFIADNYAIEETRRAKLTIDKEEEFKYDENIFVFSLSASKPHNSIAKYSIPYDIEEDHSVTFVSASEMYNTLISPARNAHRWISRLFCIQGLKPFVLTKGTVNYKADFTTKQTAIGSAGGTYYTPDMMNNIPLKGVITEEDSWEEGQAEEDSPLQERYYTTYREQEDGSWKPIEGEGDLIIPRVFKAEELSVTYPISLEQYKAIMANPYGLVVVDGEECWIKEFQYDFNSSEAEFKLIPKAK